VTGVLALLVGGVAGSVAVPGRVVAQQTLPPDAPTPGRDGPLLFQDLSVLSGGPYDFGTPTSDVEKASCAWLDADGDGWDDFIVLTGRNQPTIYWLNRPDGSGGRTFVPAPPGNGLDTGPAFERDGSAITVGDVDNDGDEDVYIGAGWNKLDWTDAPVGIGRNMLFLNDGTGRFTDVAPALGLEDGDNTTCGAVFFDMDNDADLDLLSCNTDFEEMGKAGDGVAHLFRNTLTETGTLGFVEETAERGIVEKGISVWVVFATDYDHDGDRDILIPHDIGGYTQLFRNDGNGYFLDVTNASGSLPGDDGRPSTFGNDSYAAMGIGAGDPDNDGDLDLYISDVGPMPFYRNNLQPNACRETGSATFTEISPRLGVRGGGIGWGVNFVDFDNDGWTDLYCGSGDLWNEYGGWVRSWVYKNRGAAYFQDTSAATGLTPCEMGDTASRPHYFEDVWSGSGMRHDIPLHRENGSAVADFDGDGRADLLVNRAERAGASPYLYRNETDTKGGHWLQVLATGDGVRSNVSAGGAWIRVYPKDATGTRIPGLTQLREVALTESRNARSSRRQHFGLGPDAVTCDVEVEWPRAGTLESRTVLYTDVPVDARVDIFEVPPPNTWRLDETGTVEVPDAQEWVVRCPDDGPPNALVRIDVSDAPEWVTNGPWRDGVTLRTTAPRVDAPTEFTATLDASFPAAVCTPSSGVVTILVRPAPHAFTARLRGRKVIVEGDHLDLPGLTVTIDDVLQPQPKLRAWTSAEVPAVTGRFDLKLSAREAKKLLKRVKSGESVLRVTDPATGYSAERTLTK
jgi:hypothetical protein